LEVAGRAWKCATRGSLLFIATAQNPVLPALFRQSDNSPYACGIVERLKVKKKKAPEKSGALIF
jgi:hypothetical protein